MGLLGSVFGLWSVLEFVVTALWVILAAVRSGMTKYPTGPHRTPPGTQSPLWSEMHESHLVVCMTNLQTICLIVANKIVGCRSFVCCCGAFRRGVPSIHCGSSLKTRPTRLTKIQPEYLKFYIKTCTWWFLQFMLYNEAGSDDLCLGKCYLQCGPHWK